MKLRIGSKYPLDGFDHHPRTYVIVADIKEECAIGWCYSNTGGLVGAWTGGIDGICWDRHEGAYSVDWEAYLNEGVSHGG